MQTPRKEGEKEKEQVLDLALIGQEFSPYQHCPEVYLLERIQRCNPWPEESEEHILGFLKSISGLYKAIPYHNITHAFDVMTHLDLFLVDYGWQKRLNIPDTKRIFMLITAYVHDAGHEGLTNAAYQNSNHPMAKLSSSPLEYMHINHLRRTLRESKLEIEVAVLAEMVEMILRTDNYYHGWLLEKTKKLKGEADKVLQEPKNTNILNCLLLHAADLNNTCKQTQMSVLWTGLLYEEFDYQSKLQTEKGWKVSTSTLGSPREKAGSNIYFLDHMVLPLFQQISSIEPSFERLIKQLTRNRQHWQSIANHADQN